MLKLNQVQEVPDAIFLLLAHKSNNECQAQGRTIPSLLAIIKRFCLTQDIHTFILDFHTLQVAML